MSKLAKILLAATAVASLSACMSQTTMGGQQGPVTGSAGPNGSSNVSAQLERCDRPLGIITLVESQDPALSQQLAAFKLGSPIPVLRLLMQQSNCFMIADRGQAMQTIKQERELTQAGETRSGSNMGGGQLAAADLALTPNIIFSGNSGGGAASLGGSLIPGWGGVLASTLAGSLKFTSAQSMLTLTDVRSGLQISAAQGTAESRDMGLGASLFGAGSSGALGGSIGGYANTPEGQVIAASLMDAYNNVVRTVKAMPPLPSVGKIQASLGQPNSGWVANGNLALRESPDKTAASLGKLTPGTAVTPTGRKQKGWMEVRSGDLIGWVPAKNLRRE